LESILQEVSSFSNPNFHLEQYPTSAHISAHVLYTIDKTYEEINGKIIADLGCGSGILAIGCSLLGSSHVIGIDVDPIALRDATENIVKLEAEVELLMSDVSYLPFSHKVDTTVMNPPFGTRNKGIDLVFLKKAIELSKVSVYSLHKSSTREVCTVIIDCPY